MNDVEKNKTSLIIFIALVVLIAVGGFLLIIYHHNEKKNANSSKDYNAIKVDKDKDFIYFPSAKVVSTELGIIYQDIAINLDSQDATKVSESLNKLLQENAKSVKLISEQDPLDNPPTYDTDDIYSARLQNYSFYTYRNKLILLVDQHNYDCYGIGGAHDLTSYIFNLTSGNLLSKEALLEEYQITEEEVENVIIKELNALKEKLDSTQEDLLQLSPTIDRVKNHEYTLYLNRKGELTANVVVITNEINYNEDIVIK